jgi:hypothetical protein
MDSQVCSSSKGSGGKRQIYTRSDAKLLGANAANFQLWAVKGGAISVGQADEGATGIA